MRHLFKNRDMLLGVAILFLFIFCGERGRDDSEVLARVGNRTITVNDFTRRVEFSPLPPTIYVQTMPGRKQALDLLIGEKIFAQEAVREGLETAPLLQKKIKNIESASVGRALYREAIRKHVQVEAHEIQEAYQKLNEKLIIRYLRTQNEDEAELWEQAIQHGVSFEELWYRVMGDSIDSDTPGMEITWGESELGLESAAYELEIGDVSPVIRASNGYYLLRLEHREKQDHSFTEANLSRRNTIEKIIRRRKEADRAAAFVSDFMEDKAVVLKGEPFAIMLEALEKRILSSSVSSSGASSKLYRLDDGEVTLIQNQLADHLQDILVTFQGGEWTVGTFLEKLWLQEVPIQRRSREAFTHGMREAIRIMVRDELLAQEGMRRGLGSHPTVINEVKMWEDYFLYVLFKNRMISDGIAITQALQSLRDQYPVVINEAILSQTALTEISLMAVWTDFQRHLVVPLWPRFQDEHDE